MPITNDPLLKEILSRISFRFVQPHTPASFEEAADTTVAEGHRATDVANTSIEDKDTKIFDLQLLLTPRLSTVAIGYIINKLVQQMPADQAYLNIGVWCGFSFFAGITGNEDKKCIGVDDFSDPTSVRHIFGHQYEYFRNPNARFFENEYLAYFERQHKGAIGVYFYDGGHSYKEQAEALEVADPYIAPGGYIVIDDTTYGDPRDATLNFLKKKAGQYELVLDIQSPGYRHPAFWCGVMILKKK